MELDQFYRLQFSECRTFLLLAPIKPKRDNPACFTRVWNPNQLSAEASKTQRDGTQYLNDDTLASADAARRKQNRKPAPRRQTKRPAPQCSSCHQRTGVAESASWRWSGATTERRGEYACDVHSGTGLEIWRRHNRRWRRRGEAGAYLRQLASRAWTSHGPGSRPVESRGSSEFPPCFRSIISLTWRPRDSVLTLSLSCLLLRRMPNAPNHFIHHTKAVRHVDAKREKSTQCARACPISCSKRPWSERQYGGSDLGGVLRAGRLWLNGFCRITRVASSSISL
ncbi:hypothetical protein IWX90DRAFT_302469 [Phyllosticta citrichinensis]|uniref:Uncharacterized protein n=1 Tax=Phyllosticta citrichinensis TaxID=1130410 RepID=A0ABR1XL16_9PEZI